MSSLLRAFGSAGGVLATAARLLGRHWPTLFAITLFGVAARSGLLWLATEASEISNALGSLTFALIPIAVLTSYTLAFLVLRQSLPGLAATERVKGRLIGDIGSALVPFIVIYASYGDLQQDFASYLYSILTSQFGGSVTERMPFSLNRAMWIAAGCAVAVRTLLDWWPRSNRFRLVGFVKAYLDVISVVIIWVTIVKPAINWLWDRQAAHTIDEWMSGAKWAWTGAIDAIEPVIIVPVAWLAVAAVIYGDKLRDLPTPAEFATYRRLSILPKRARTAVLGVVNPGGRFGALILAARVLRRANLPMLMLFCLSFVVVRTVPRGLWELERVLVGPQDLGTVWWSLSYIFGGLNSAIGSAVLICLVAAATEQFVLAQRATAPAAPRPLGEGQPGVTGQRGAEHDAHGDRPGVGRGDEEDLYAKAG
ncbi:hypothetical protein F4553_003980 [Allocatelliglobosispora scoriae]|uniref:Uncharacterized protein n=1 Tax=Allocatelliglobosispora scoriae TaxID=643052 RepID=A0A841BV25_9ACTN|nr:hypothetical protein [Allocatelliglobosispora scoriae]MBB5870601.1 hypothetical protein [Allocatelliglobosispora scoriae]